MGRMMWMLLGCPDGVKDGEGSAGASAAEGSSGGEDSDGVTDSGATDAPIWDLVYDHDGHTGARYTAHQCDARRQMR
jgi:hypothetical protein